MTKRICLVIFVALLLLSAAACAKPEALPTPALDVTPVTVQTEPDAADVPATTDGLGIKILLEHDDSMINNYTVIAVNDAAPFKDADGNAVRGVAVNTAGAAALIDWLMSSEAAKLIEGFGMAEYGEALFTLKNDKPTFTEEIVQANDATKVIRLSTTTSVNDSGLLAYLLPAFENQYGYTVEVSSAGTGKAIAAATMGNADLILVHSKSQEEAFVADGYAKLLDGYTNERLTFMYNYFVLIGPVDDLAKCAEAGNVKEAFARIAEGKFAFVSRGDASGTHTKEVSLWPESLGITVDPASVAAYTEWYLFSNAGMGVCLTMANEIDGYIFSDKATFLAFAASGGAVG
ncbi:MAG: substrate-binding domain-containing protein [Eubacteriales bacterium]|jgi:ABC-type tungstate transport system permease subunit|nr:substrate-binding domain-containing protein [Eubacteriales bacterium]